MTRGNTCSKVHKELFICLVILLAGLSDPCYSLSAGPGVFGHRVRRGTPANRPPGCNVTSSVRSLSIYYYEGEGFYVQHDCVDPGATAYGYARPSLNATGWDILEVATNATATEASQDNRMTMFAAGLLEGLLTADRIDAHYANLVDGLLPRDVKQRGQVELKLRQWLREQVDWAQNFSDANPADPLARNVGYILAQLRGLINGYTIASLETQNDPEFVLHLTNAAADAADVLNVLADRWLDWRKMGSHEFSRYVSSLGHCTALVRLLPGLEDLIMAHNTWNSYSSTLRIFKHYNLRLANDPSFVGGRQSFGGYPGTLASLDAFYAIDNRLVLLQTTNNVFNASLFASVTPRSLLAWQRVRAANQLATSGAHWAEQFSRFNSGTYNNQYMLVDLRRFRSSVALDAGALTIVEQIPGLVQYSDQTAILRTGYWPSYNVPFHEDIYRISGYPGVVQKFGLDYSYQLAPRAKILRRDAVAIATDLNGMRRLMRLNRYPTDPYSKGDPCKCLCCRGDLYSPGEPFGCYDAKVTSDGLLRSRGASSTDIWAISGPTEDEGRLPAFKWSQFQGRNVSHTLLPGVYNFTWALMRNTLL